MGQLERHRTETTRTAEDQVREVKQLDADLDRARRQVSERDRRIAHFEAVLLEKKTRIRELSVQLASIWRRAIQSS